MNDCTEKFDSKDGAIVLVDFINYIAERNDYNKEFTIEQLYERFESLNNKSKTGNKKVLK